MSSLNGIELKRGLKKFQVTVTSTRKQQINQRRIRQVQPAQTLYFAGGELSRA